MDGHRYAENLVRQAAEVQRDYSGTPTSPLRESSPIPDALLAQERELENLDKTISVLEERLRLVLGPPPPSVNKALDERNGPAPARVGIRERLEQACHVAGTATCRLEGLMNRLEL